MIENTYKLVEGSLKNCKVRISGMSNRKPFKFIIDSEDIAKAKKHTWRVNENLYICCSKCKVLYHRYILDIQDNNIIVDHHNRIPFDNRKKNLRVATHKQNRWNSKLKDKTYNLPVNGVKPLSDGRWRATIVSNRVTIKLGTFDHVYDAVLARVRAEYERRGVYTPNYRHFLKKIPGEFLNHWLPEIYGKDNVDYIGTEIWYAHYKPDHYSKKKNWIKHCKTLHKHLVADKQGAKSTM